MPNPSPILVIEFTQQPQGRGNILFVYERAGGNESPVVLPQIRACLSGTKRFSDLRESHPGDADTIRVIQNIAEDSHLSNDPVYCSEEEIYETVRGVWKITIFLPKKV